jgi:hypothetical protein
MQKEDIREGVYVRRLCNYLRIPAGAVGTVDLISVEREEF